MAENKTTTACCPICDKPAAPKEKGSPYPFCSPRCQLADLGKWLDGDYVIPGPPASNFDD